MFEKNLDDGGIPSQTCEIEGPVALGIDRVDVRAQAQEHGNNGCLFMPRRVLERPRSISARSISLCCICPRFPPSAMGPIIQL